MAEILQGCLQNGGLSATQEETERAAELNLGNDMEVVTDKLAEIALAFCKECLGWSNPLHQPGDVHHVCNMAPGDWNSLAYTSIEPVTRAVELWCKDQQYAWCVLGRPDGKYAANVLGTPDSPRDGIGRSALCDSPCEALMSACLAAVGYAPPTKQAELFEH